MLYEVITILRKTRCSIAVLDVTMPRMDGIELLEKVASEWPDTVVIMLTAHDDVSSAVTCIKKGAFDYLVKPGSENSWPWSNAKNGVARRLVSAHRITSYHVCYTN